MNTYKNADRCALCKGLTINGPLCIVCESTLETFYDARETRDRQDRLTGKALRTAKRS